MAPCSGMDEGSSPTVIIFGRFCNLLDFNSLLFFRNEIKERSIYWVYSVGYNRIHSFNL